MTLPACLMCDDKGYKDHGGLCLDPCDHMQLPPLPELKPCPNPACRSTRVHYKADLRGAQSITCRDCGLSTTMGGQDHQYAMWNGLLRADPGPPKAWLYANKHGDAELIFNRNTEYAVRLREQGYSEDPLYVGVPMTGREAENG